MSSLRAVSSHSTPRPLDEQKGQRGIFWGHRGQNSRQRFITCYSYHQIPKLRNETPIQNSKLIQRVCACVFVCVCVSVCVCTIFDWVGNILSKISPKLVHSRFQWFFFPDFMKFLFPCQIYFLGFRGGHRNHQWPQITPLFPPGNGGGRHAAQRRFLRPSISSHWLSHQLDQSSSVIEFPIIDRHLTFGFWNRRLDRCAWS